MFEDEFTKILQKYPNAVSDKKIFTGLMKDYFPEKPMQVNLINTAYYMGVSEEIEKAPQITNAFAFRFVKRLMNEHGISRMNADWVISAWCVCYGKRILGKNCEIEISKANKSGFVPSIKEDLPSDKKLYNDLFTYKAIPDGYGISGFTGDNCKTLIFPNAYKGKKVTKILEGAFENCAVEEAVINEGISVIEARAFKDCKVLKQIIFPTSVKEIGDEAFCGCEKLAMATLPQEIEQIGRYAFSHTALKQLDLPENILWIGDGAYKNCSKLSLINLPSNTKELPNEIFKGCSSLKKLELPETLETIGIETFADCYRLINMIVPERVMAVGVNAFKGMNQKFTLICARKSVVEEYARKHNIPFQITF